MTTARLRLRGELRNWLTATLTARRVDALLGVATVATAATGLASWAVGTGWARWLTIPHAVAGLSLMALAPAKLRGSVRTGLKRRRPSRWLSMTLGGLVTATVALGVLHATGLWRGVGYWSALWTHVLAAALVVPLVVWHIVSRPRRARLGDMDRRAFIGGVIAAGAAGAAYWAQQLIVGDNRRFTGSHEIASFRPAEMPTTMWLDDRVPPASRPYVTDAGPSNLAGSSDWELRVGGEAVPLGALADAARPVVADLDCTGGWWSRQSWDAVPLAELLKTRLGEPPLSESRLGETRLGGSQAPAGTAAQALEAKRSIEVVSATGYSRLFPASDAAHLYLATGYGGEPLRRGHGAPVRLVAPGRRGFWWVKWVLHVNLTDRPWWLQLPFPLT